MLRKKLEADPAEPVWVRTVRGFGYRLGTGPLKLQEEEKPANKKR
jgi:DNA-binding winged helix-turn-helix (wHTH) protein